MAWHRIGNKTLPEPVTTKFTNTYMHHSSSMTWPFRCRYKKCKGFDLHDGIIKWKHFPRKWPFVRGIHRSPVNSPHKGQWRGDLKFSLICVWINDWVHNREAGDLRRCLAHYDVIVMCWLRCLFVPSGASRWAEAYSYRVYHNVCLLMQNHNLHSPEFLISVPSIQCVVHNDKNLILGCLWLLVFVLNILILGFWCSTIPHLPGCFCPWTFFENIGFNTVLTDPFMLHLATQPYILQGSFRLCNWLS